MAGSGDMAGRAGYPRTGALSSRTCSPPTGSVRFTLTLATPSARLAAEGEAQLGDTTAHHRREALSRPSSVRDFTRWSGLDLPFGSLLRAVSVNGDFSMDRRRLSWPAVSVTLGATGSRAPWACASIRSGQSSPARSPPTSSTSRICSRPSPRPVTASGAWSEESHRPHAGDRMRSRPAPLGAERQSGPCSASTTWPPACWSSRAGSRPPSGARISMTAP